MCVCVCVCVWQASVSYEPDQPGVQNFTRQAPCFCVSLAIAKSVFVSLSTQSCTRARFALPFKLIAYWLLPVVTTKQYDGEGRVRTVTYLLLVRVYIFY